jgi:hypothetical protein
METSCYPYTHNLKRSDLHMIAQTNASQQSTNRELDELTSVQGCCLLKLAAGQGLIRDGTKFSNVKEEKLR